MNDSDQYLKYKNQIMLKNLKNLKNWKNNSIIKNKNKIINL